MSRVFCFSTLIGLAVLLCGGCDRPVTRADRASAGAAVPADATEPQAGNLATLSDALPALLARPDNLTALEMTFDDIKFEMGKTDRFDKSMLTPQIEQLFGQKIRIRGYILPTMRQRGLKEFVLVRDNLECCFGAGAALFDCILIQMTEGKTAEYTIRPVSVEGTFRFQEFIGPDNRHLAIFRLEAEKVE